MRSHKTFMIFSWLLLVLLSPLLLPLVFARAAPALLSTRMISPNPAVRIGNAITTTTHYDITDLGTINGLISSSGKAINDLGQVIGQSGLNPFLWLPAPAYGLPAGMHNLKDIDPDATRATDINNAGLIVGQRQGGITPAIWQWQSASQSWLTTDLPVESGGGNAWGVNELGHVVGSVTTNFGGVEGIIWQNNSSTMLTSLGGVDSQGLAINDFGVVAGWSEDAQNNSLAALWPTPAGPQNLGALPASSASSALDVNGWGEVVGISYPDGFIWLPSAAYGLGPGMHALTPPGIMAEAKGINDLGQVVGKAFIPGEQSNGFVWENGITFDLNTLIEPNSGWIVIDASDINEAGQIVGTGIKDGSSHAILLTPRKWTLLFYIAGDDPILGPSYNGIFQQIEAAAGVPGVTVLVAWDNRPDGDSAYYVIQPDTDPVNPAAYVEGTTMFSKGELVMSDPLNLADFIEWGVTSYPSDHVALILEDHGSGLGGGLCDGGCSTNKMSLNDIKLALDIARTQTGNKIDVLFSAMCLMGMLEDAYQFLGNADYYVANEDLMYSPKAPYVGYIQGITPLSTPEDVAINFAVSYADVMTATVSTHTISVLDMSQIDPLVTATNGLAAQLDTYMPLIANTMITITQVVQRFDDRAPSGQLTLGDTYVDLYDFADLAVQQLSAFPDITAAAEGVKTAVKNAVIYESHKSNATKNLNYSHGISIFLPATASSFYNPNNYDFAVGANWGGDNRLNSPAAVTWAGMLGSYFAITQPNGSDDPNLPLPVVKLPLKSYTVYLPLLNQ